MTTTVRFLGAAVLGTVLLTGCNAIEPKRPAWAMDDFPQPTAAAPSTWLAKSPASVFAPKQATSPAATAVTTGVTANQASTPYVWDKLRSALMPPAPPAAIAALPDEPVGGSADAGGENKAPQMTASQVLDKLRAAMPEITEDQMRNLAIAAGAAYVLSKSSPTVASSTAATTATTPSASTAIPDKTINLSPSVSMALEKVVWWGAYAGVAYMILDPLNPNWEIEQASFPKQTYHLSLKMKRFYSGGAGEARSVFQDRAKQLMRQSGADGFNILEYSEGLDSSVIGSQRVARGVIQLTNKAG